MLLISCSGSIDFVVLDSSAHLPQHSRVGQSALALQGLVFDHVVETTAASADISRPDVRRDNIG